MTNQGKIWDQFLNHLSAGPWGGVLFFAVLLVAFYALLWTSDTQHLIWPQIELSYGSRTTIKILLVVFGGSFYAANLISAIHNIMKRSFVYNKVMVSAVIFFVHLFFSILISSIFKNEYFVDTMLIFVFGWFAILPFGPDKLINYALWRY